MTSVLVVGDSLPFPRATRGQTLQEAWPQLLREDPSIEAVWVRARGAATSDEVLAEVRHLAGYLRGPAPAFDVAVVQVGIVDSTPRPLPRKVQLLANRIRLGTLVKRHHRTLLRLRAKPWVGRDAFVEAVEATVVELSTFCARVVLIEIASPGPALVAKALDFTDAVAHYNAGLRELALRHRASVVAAPSEAAQLLEDGHHLSAAGHRFVADGIAAVLTGSS